MKEFFVYTCSYLTISYVGNWKHDLPHESGKQYYETGWYEGEFRNDERHGHGRWETHDGKWKYLPIDGPQGNWEADLMHGIGIIEDAEYIHENVIFKKGSCQMPFTLMGPPQSGFDRTPLVGGAELFVLELCFYTFFWVRLIIILRHRYVVRV